MAKIEYLSEPFGMKIDRKFDEMPMIYFFSSYSYSKYLDNRSGSSDEIVELFPLFKLAISDKNNKRYLFGDWVVTKENTLPGILVWYDNYFALIFKYCFPFYVVRHVLKKELSEYEIVNRKGYGYL